MSLLDALLLDPVRINVWIACRTDGIAGSGTQNDPYDGSTLDRFDYVMRELIEDEVKTCVHLGPGEFLTAGYHDDQGENEGWQAKPGMKIVGSGIDVTKVKVVPASQQDKSYYAIGHVLSAITVDFFEACDMTIDCNFEGLPIKSTAGAVRVMGNHSRVCRLKIINWGNNKSVADGSLPRFIVAMLAGDPALGVMAVQSCGIEYCIAVEPADSQDNIGRVAVFHIGQKEGISEGTEAACVAPYLKNNYVDCGASNGISLDVRALSMAWCKGGFVEGNVILNTKYGGPHQEIMGAQNINVRNNRYRNVLRGPYWILTDKGVNNLIIESNEIELSVDALINDYAIQVEDSGELDPYRYQNVVIRNNHIRYADNSIDGVASGVLIRGIQNLQVRENILELNPASDQLVDQNCQSAAYLNNRKPDGTLIRGYNDGTSMFYDELETDAEAAMVLSIFKK